MAVGTKSLARAQMQAELEYTAQRAEELREKVYGGQVNNETINDAIAGVAEVLRRGGSSDLADRYQAAFHRISASAAGETHSGDDDGEEFERIAVEVAAWLDYKMGEGKPRRWQTGSRSISGWRWR